MRVLRYISASVGYPVHSGGQTEEHLGQRLRQRVLSLFPSRTLQEEPIGQHAILGTSRIALLRLHLEVEHYIVDRDRVLTCIILR